ncbi:hypothetical protein NY486_26020, partial [Enterobacter hormaechei]|nr:hypothetical protein [Enterobacter hormaechei]
LLIYVIKDPEAFARNVAHMIEQAGKAASAWVEPREKGLKRDTIADPVTDVVKTLSRVSEYWLSEPGRALEAQTKLFASYMAIWSNSIRRMSGEQVDDVVKPDKGDKRFADEDWGRNAFFDFL